MIRWSGLAVVALCASAHADPVFEASGFTGIEYFGNDIGLGNSYASEQIPGTSLLLGARLLYLAEPEAAEIDDIKVQVGLETELGVALSQTGGAFDGGRMAYFAPVFAYRAHFMFRLAGAAVQPFLLLGAGGETVVSTSPYMDKDTDPILYWGPGFDARVSDTWRLRVDVRHGVMPARSGWTSEFELQLGMTRSFELAHHRPKKVHREEPPPPEPKFLAHDEDSDGDGIPDRLDKCPTQPETINGYEDADGCPEADPDGDGIVGTRDKCPDQPEDFDGFQDADGCPDPDNDGDGIPDAIDACPNEPETKNGIADDDGCPDTVPADLTSTFRTLAVRFESGRARMTATTKADLAALVAILGKYPDTKIVVTGHPTSKGAADLARRRAEGVKWYLVDQGVLADRITTTVGEIAGSVISVALATP